MEDLYTEDTNVLELKKINFDISKKKIKIKSNINKKINGLLICYAPWCTHCVLTKEMWIKLSDLFKSKFNFFSLNTYNFNDKNQMLVKDLNLKVYPTYKCIDSEGNISDYTDGKTEDEFIKYIMNNLVI